MIYITDSSNGFITDCPSPWIELEWIFEQFSVEMNYHGANHEKRSSDAVFSLSLVGILLMFLCMETILQHITQYWWLHVHFSGLVWQWKVYNIPVMIILVCLMDYMVDM